MKNIQNISELGRNIRNKVSNLINWIGTTFIPDSLQGKLLFILLLSSGAVIKYNQTARSRAITFSTGVLNNSIHYADQGATLWGKAIGGSLNYVHPNLSKEVKDNISLYAPILSALVIQPISLTFNLFGTLLAQHTIKQQQKVGELANSIKILFDRAMLALKSNDLDSFHKAAMSFRQSRHLYKSLSKANSLLAFTLTEIYYNEALAFFSMHCYSDPQRKYALEVLNELLSIDKDFIEAINLRGIIYFYLNNMDNAISDFNKSLDLDNTQTDIHTFLNFCKKSYKKTVSYSFSHLDKKSTWQNNAIHLLLNCRANAYYELHKEQNVTNEYKKDMLAKAISAFEAAEMAIPKNPSYEADRIKNLNAMVEALILLIKLLADNESISIKRLFEKPSPNKEASTHQNSNGANGEPVLENKKDRTKSEVISLAIKYVNIIQKINPDETIKDIKELAAIAQKAGIKEPNSIRYTPAPLV